MRWSSYVGDRAVVRWPRGRHRIDGSSQCRHSAAAPVGEAIRSIWPATMNRRSCGTRHGPASGETGREDDRGAFVVERLVQPAFRRHRRLGRPQRRRQVGLRDDRDHAGQVGLERRQEAAHVRAEREPEDTDGGRTLVGAEPRQQPAEIPDRLRQTEHVVDGIDVRDEHPIRSEPLRPRPVQREHRQCHVDAELLVEPPDAEHPVVARPPHALAVDGDEPGPRAARMAHQPHGHDAVGGERSPPFAARLAVDRLPAAVERAAPRARRAARRSSRPGTSVGAGCRSV